MKVSELLLPQNSRRDTSVHGYESSLPQDDIKARVDELTAAGKQYKQIMFHIKNEFSGDAATFARKYMLNVLSEHTVLPDAPKKISVLKELLSKYLPVSKAKQALKGVLETNELGYILDELEEKDPEECAVEPIVAYIKMHHPDIEKYFRNDYQTLPSEMFSPLGHKDVK
jgi:hypothetical protein